MTGQTEQLTPLPPVERMTPQEIDELAYAAVVVGVMVFAGSAFAAVMR